MEIQRGLAIAPGGYPDNKWLGFSPALEWPLRAFWGKVDLLEHAMIRHHYASKRTSALQWAVHRAVCLQCFSLNYWMSKGQAGRSIRFFSNQLWMEQLLSYSLGNVVQDLTFQRFTEALRKHLCLPTQAVLRSSAVASSSVSMTDVPLSPEDAAWGNHLQLDLLFWSLWDKVIFNQTGPQGSVKIILQYATYTESRCLSLWATLGNGCPCCHCLRGSQHPFSALMHLRRNGRVQQRVTWAQRPENGAPWQVFAQ